MEEDREKLARSQGIRMCTLDGCHANDLGAYRIAHALAPTIERSLHRWRQRIGGFAV